MDEKLLDQIEINALNNFVLPALEGVEYNSGNIEEFFDDIGEDIEEYLDDPCPERMVFLYVENLSNSFSYLENELSPDEQISMILYWLLPGFESLSNIYREIGVGMALIDLSNFSFFNTIDEDKMARGLMTAAKDITCQAIENHFDELKDDEFVKALLNLDTKSIEEIQDEKDEDEKQQMTIPSEDEFDETDWGFD